MKHVRGILIGHDFLLLTSCSSQLLFPEEHDTSDELQKYDFYVVGETFKPCLINYLTN